MWLVSLASGRFAAAAAASRPQAISPNTVVFVVHDLTFMNVDALDLKIERRLQSNNIFGNVLQIRDWLTEAIGCVQSMDEKRNTTRAGSS